MIQTQVTVEIPLLSGSKVSKNARSIKLISELEHGNPDSAVIRIVINTEEVLIKGTALLKAVNNCLNS
jgi:hypothetical protein